MELVTFNDIKSVAYSTGWEVEPQMLPDGSVALSSALHGFTCAIHSYQDKGFGIKFSSPLLYKEVLAKHGVLIQQPIGDIEVLYEILKDASRLSGSLPNSPVREYEHELMHASLDQTQIRREVEQRIGQSIYRTHMLSYWGGECALTGIRDTDLLIASHAKPWKDCVSAEERLSVFNGFLLEARYDRLFDQGFITFADNGTIIVSEQLKISSRQLLGIEPDMQLRWIRDEHLPFLHWHQEHVYKRGL
jgi:predicted restriction endonuclease